MTKLTRMALRVALGVCLWAPTLHADASTCQRAHERAQVLRNADQPLAARAELLRCAARSCPGPLRRDCAEWLSEVQRQVPSIVPAVQTPSGSELSEVQVFVDGELVLERIDGRALELEPGTHKLRFESSGYDSSELSVIARLGERERQLQVVLSPHTEPGPPAPFWILSGVSVAALASFTTFAFLGNQRYQELSDECAPQCDPDSSSSVRDRFLIADISLGVALLSAGGAAYFYFREREDETHVQVKPLRSGAALGFGGRF